MDIFPFPFRSQHLQAQACMLTDCGSYLGLNRVMGLYNSPGSQRSRLRFLALPCRSPQSLRR